MLNVPHITISEATLVDFCQRHHIRKLALFGSVLRDDFTPDSDIDVLVEFEPDYTPGLAFFAIQEELAETLGRDVDLLTFKEVLSMDNYIRRRHILNATRIIYDMAG
ncbi:MAG: nucleotidyltransferase family protein [Chloroflexota bacterium]